MKEEESLAYDFERDEWVNRPSFIQAKWNERELPRPTEPPAPGRWHRPAARATFPWRRLIRPLSLLTTALAISALAVLGIIVGVMLSLASPIAGLGAVAALWGGGGWMIVRAFPNRQVAEGVEAISADLSLLEDPGDPDVCLVEMEIVYRGISLGADRGVVWFEGGRLLFTGHRTSFAIGGEDVLPRGEWPSQFGDRWHSVLPADALPLRRPSGSTCVRFTPVRHGPDWRQSASQFTERLRVFRTRPPQSRGPRQWPPFGP